MDEARATKLLFTCGREPEYIRNAVLQKALVQNYDVVSITDQTHWLPLRYLKLGLRLAAFRKPVDGMIVGFYGQPLMLLVRRLTRLPILFDAHISTYDTLCFDRKRFKPGSMMGRLAFWIDLMSCKLADLVIIDTQAHADYFQRTFGVPSEKIFSLYVGCNEEIFSPRQNGPPQVEGRVMTFGSFMPLHGIDTILRAASLLQNNPTIHFHLFGEGMESKRNHQLAEELALKNVFFFPLLPQRELPDQISQASICLGGHFGSSEKAGRVIAGKTYECLAMGKAVIVGDNAANRELLTHGKDAYFCKMADPVALADAIRTLIENPTLRKSLGENARQTFLERASLPMISQQLKRIVEKLVCNAS
jgi:glycosyltransferase involved in cell wall biosynthesis